MYECILMDRVKVLPQIQVLITLSINATDL